MVAKAEGESNIAAGDFVINYNSDHVICTSVEVDESVQSNGGYIVTNENISEGKISFFFKYGRNYYGSVTCKNAF